MVTMYIWVNRKTVTFPANPIVQHWSILGDLPHNKVGSKICRFCSKSCRHFQPHFAYLSPFHVGEHHTDHSQVPPDIVGPLGGYCWIVSSCCHIPSVRLGALGGVCLKGVSISRHLAAFFGTEWRPDYSSQGWTLVGPGDSHMWRPVMLS